jgi:hypothetical protein
MEYIIPVLVVIIWLVPSIVALVGLRRREMDEIARVLWVLVIFAFPLIGPIAFFVVQPAKKSDVK